MIGKAARKLFARLRGLLEDGSAYVLIWVVTVLGYGDEK